MFAALAILNVVLATILVIVIAERPEPTPIARPGGGGSVDAQTTEIIQRLQQEQRDLERKLAEIQELRTLVEQLNERIHRCEQTVKRDPPGPKPIVTPSPCDEVSCVLANYESPCCAKFRPSALRPKRNTSTTPALPEALGRAAIAAGMTAVRARVDACGQQSTAKGTVKVNVRVSPAGRPESVIVTRTPDDDLGACVASVVQDATFAATQDGGSFSYPFTF
jgi:hypothetical protein